MRIPCNPGRATWPGGSFRPNGDIVLVGDDAIPNGRAWTSKDVLAARLFVGFNVGGKPRWTLANLIPIVRAERSRQGRSQDASFLAQKGVYTSKVDGSVIEEDGAQIIVINEEAGVKQKAFEKEMVALGTAIARLLKQELVIVEIQKNGMTKAAIGVTPK